MDRFQEMKVLLAVTEAESFAGGAKLLGISPPSVTRTVAALEARQGTLLLARSTRSLRLSEAGQRQRSAQPVAVRRRRGCFRLHARVTLHRQLQPGSDLRRTPGLGLHPRAVLPGGRGGGARRA